MSDTRFKANWYRFTHDGENITSITYDGLSIHVNLNGCYVLEGTNAIRAKDHLHAWQIATKWLKEQAK